MSASVGESSSTAVLLLLACWCAAAGAQSSITWFISPDGNDAWAGSIGSPWRSPGRANEAIWYLQRPLAGNVTVFLRAGVYVLGQTLLLGSPRDSGEGVDAVVTWAKYPGDAGDAVLTGGAAVGVWAVAPDAAPGIWRAQLPTGVPLPWARALFVNGVPRTLARVPAVAGPARSDIFSDESTLHMLSSLSGCGFKGSCWVADCPASDANGFVYDASDPRSPTPTMRELGGIDVVSFCSWTAAWARIGAVFAENSTLLTRTPLSIAPPGAMGGNCTSGGRFAMFNVFEALKPGSQDFYVSDALGAIYYAPSAAEAQNMTALQAVVPWLDTVLSISGNASAPARFLTFQGLNVTVASEGGGGRDAAGFAPTGAIEIAYASNVVLRDVSVVNAGGTGIKLGDGVSDLTVSGCEVHGAGGDGIGGWAYSGRIQGASIIEDCVVEGVGLVYMQQPTGLRLQAAPNSTVVVTHNVVRVPLRGAPSARVDSRCGSVRCETLRMLAFLLGGTQARRPPLPVATGAMSSHRRAGREGWCWRRSDGRVIGRTTQNIVEDCGQGILNDFGGIYVRAHLSVAGADAPRVAQVSSDGYACEASESCYIRTFVDSNLVQRVRGYAGAGSAVYVPPPRAWWSLPVVRAVLQIHG